MTVNVFSTVHVRNLLILFLRAMVITVVVVRHFVVKQNGTNNRSAALLYTVFQLFILDSLTIVFVVIIKNS